jgi:hypothetical protein
VSTPAIASIFSKPESGEAEPLEKLLPAQPEQIDPGKRYAGERANGAAKSGGWFEEFRVERRFGKPGYSEKVIITLLSNREAFGGVAGNLHGDPGRVNLGALDGRLPYPGHNSRLSGSFGCIRNAPADNEAWPKRCGLNANPGVLNVARNAGSCI